LCKNRPIKIIHDLGDQWLWLPGLMICLIIFDRHIISFKQFSHEYQYDLIWISKYGHENTPYFRTNRKISHGCVYHMSHNKSTEMHGFATITSPAPGIKVPHRHPSRPSKCPKSPTARRRSCADPPPWTPRKLAAKPPGKEEKWQKTHGFVGFHQQKPSNILGLTSKTWGLKLVYNQRNGDLQFEAVTMYIRNCTRKVTNVANPNAINLQLMMNYTS
jgi:hypothetical protein